MARQTRTSVRFAGRYSDENGNLFRRYKAPDGRVAVVCVRLGRCTCTNAEARAEAIRKLYGGRR
jgi:nuclear transport factor 2 (NTF2) superfamily protein